MTVNGDWQRIITKLKELRLAQPGFADYSKFKEVSGINRPTVEATENGQNRPSLDIIRKWVGACGVKLGEFFTDLDGPQAGKVPKDSMKLLIKRGNRQEHERLEAILNAGGAEAEWLRGNIEVFHGNHVRKPRE